MLCIFTAEDLADGHRVAAIGVSISGAHSVNTDQRALRKESVQ